MSDDLFYLTDEEEPFEQSNYFTDLFLQYIFLIHILCPRILTLYIKPFGFHFVAWDHFEYHTPFCSGSFPWVFCNELPRTNISEKVDGTQK